MLLQPKQLALTVSCLAAYATKVTPHYQPSSAAVERLFSVALHVPCARMLGEMLDKLLFLHC